MICRDRISAPYSPPGARCFRNNARPAAPSRPNGPSGTTGTWRPKPSAPPPPPPPPRASAEASSTSSFAAAAAPGVRPSASSSLVLTYRRSSWRGSGSGVQRDSGGSEVGPSASSFLVRMHRRSSWRGKKSERGTEGAEGERKGTGRGEQSGKPHQASNGRPATESLVGQQRRGETNLAGQQKRAYRPATDSGDSCGRLAMGKHMRPLRRPRGATCVPSTAAWHATRSRTAGDGKRLAHDKRDTTSCMAGDRKRLVRDKRDTTSCTAGDRKRLARDKRDTTSCTAGDRNSMGSGLTRLPTRCSRPAPEACEGTVGASGALLCHQQLCSCRSRALWGGLRAVLGRSRFAPISVVECVPRARSVVECVPRARSVVECVPRAKPRDGSLTGWSRARQPVPANAHAAAQDECVCVAKLSQRRWRGGLLRF
eukprot:363824-Chlamydomonas_euryale.AAC.13